MRAKVLEAVAMTRASEECCEVYGTSLMTIERREEFVVYM